MREEFMISEGMGLALLGLFSTITAAIIKFTPQRKNNCYLTREEFNNQCSLRMQYLNSELAQIREDIKILQQDIKSLLRNFNK